VGPGPLQRVAHLPAGALRTVDRAKLWRSRAARGRLSGMAFKVRFSEERDRMSDYDTGDVYEFLEGGVLSIAYAPNKAKWTEYHGPGTWVRVAAEPRHLPGQSGH
jgi:hypothetical protein